MDHTQSSRRSLITKKVSPTVSIRSPLSPPVSKPSHRRWSSGPDIHESTIVFLPPVYYHVENHFHKQLKPAASALTAPSFLLPPNSGGQQVDSTRITATPWTGSLSGRIFPKNKEKTKDSLECSTTRDSCPRLYSEFSRHLRSKKRVFRLV